MAKKRFQDKVPFEVIETKIQNKDFLSGASAAKKKRKRNKSKGLDWLLGYDSVKG